MRVLLAVVTLVSFPALAAPNAEQRACVEAKVARYASLCEAANIIEQTEYCAFGSESLSDLARLLRDRGRDDEAETFERKLDETVADGAARI